MTRGRWLAAAAVLAAAGLALPACGTGVPVDELAVTGAWARPTPAGAANGVVYFSIASPDDDTIVGVSVPTDVAGDAAVHDSAGEGDDEGGGHEGHRGGSADMAGMTEQGRVELPADTTVTFAPGGLHVMLTDLPEPLAVGDRFDLTLELANAGPFTTEVVVAQNQP